MRPPWPRVKLGEVCEFRRGLTYSKKDEVSSSKNVVLRSNNVDLTTGKIDLSELKYISDSFAVPLEKKVINGSVLMCMANGSKSHLGKVALIGEDYGYAFGGFMGLLVPSVSVLPSYLYWILSGYEFKQLIASLTDGANINNLKFADIADFEFPLPPLPVQREIVARLERELGAVDELAKKFEELEQTAEAEFKAELKETFEELGNGADGTRHVQFGEVSETLSTRGHQIKQSEICEAGRYPVVSQSANAIEGFTDVEIPITDTPIVLFGDHTCEVKLIERPFVVGADGVKLLRASGAGSEYLYHWLKHASLQLLDGEYRRHYSDLCEMTIPLPPLPVQREIVARLDAAKARKEALVSAAKHGREAAALWRKSILKEAFE